MWVSPMRLRSFVAVSAFIIGTAALVLVGWLLIAVGAVRVAPSAAPFYEATPFVAAFLMVGWTALLVINIRAKRGRAGKPGIAMPPRNR